MSEKRFIIIHLGNPYDFVVKDLKTNKTYGTSDDDKNYLLDLLNRLSEENEQLRQQLQEYKENWDDMVELATKTSLRNVELDEQIGQLQKELDDCEKFRYSVFKRIGEIER